MPARFCVVGDAFLVQETISGTVLFFFVFGILFVRETVNQEIFVFDVLLVRQTVDQEICVFDHQQRFCVRRFIGSTDSRPRDLCVRLSTEILCSTFLFV